MTIKIVIDEDFSNYNKPSILLASDNQYAERIS